MSFLRSCLLYLASCAVRSARGASNLDLLSNETSCGCYLTNGTVPKYFTNHLFFDFRDLGEFAGVPKPITNSSLSALASPSSDYFESDKWNNAWGIQNWTNKASGGVSLGGDASVLLINSPNNVYIGENDDDDASSDTYLSMRTKRLPGFQSAAEFESVSTYKFLSLRMLARTVGSPGACTAMFTYRAADDVAKVQEADIEVLTEGPRDKIQYTNQPSFSDDEDDIPEATRNATLPGHHTWDDWLVHRLDWTPERSVWYVAGHEVANIQFQTPKDAAQVIFNAWSDGGEWSGNMTINDEAYLQIQWIEMVYNTTGEDPAERKRDIGSDGDLARRAGDEQCRVVCSIDERDEVGTAKVLWNSTNAESKASVAGGLRIGWLGMGSWLLGVAVLLCLM